MIKKTLLQNRLETFYRVSSPKICLREYIYIVLSRHYVYNVKQYNIK